MKNLIWILVLIPNICYSEMMNKDFENAVVFGQHDIVIKLINENPAVISSVDKYGFTALHLVGTEDDVEMVELLIQSGADVNAEDDQGNTPLYLSLYPEVVTILLSSGAKLEHENNLGETPLHAHAAEQDSENVMRILLESGADPLHENRKGQTPVDIALMRQEFRKVELLNGYINK